MWVQTLEVCGASKAEYKSYLCKGSELWGCRELKRGKWKNGGFDTECLKGWYFKDRLAMRENVTVNGNLGGGDFSFEEDFNFLWFSFRCVFVDRIYPPPLLPPFYSLRLPLKHYLMINVRSLLCLRLTFYNCLWTKMYQHGFILYLNFHNSKTWNHGTTNVDIFRLKHLL